MTFVKQSSGRRTAVESMSNRSCNHRIIIIIVIVYYARRQQNHTNKTPKTQNYTTVHTSKNDKTPQKHHIKVVVVVVVVVVVIVVVEIFVHGAVKATVTNAPQSQLNKWVFGSFLNWPTVVSDWCSEVGRLHGKGVERVSPGKWGDRVYCLPSQPTAQSGGALWAHDEFYSFYISRKVEQQYGDDRNRLWILLCALYCRAFTLSSDLRESRDRVMGQLPHLPLPRGDPNDSAM